MAIKEVSGQIKVNDAAIAVSGGAFNIHLPRKDMIHSAAPCSNGGTSFRFFPSDIDVAPKTAPDALSFSESGYKLDTSLR